MAIAFRSQTSLGGTAASVSVIKPSGAIAGDVLVVDIVTAGATVTVVPSGWTQITNVQTGLTARLFSYWHVVGASDPGPWAFTLSVSGAYSHICACYEGVDNTTPLDVAATTVGNNTAGASIVVPAVSPVTANTMLHSGVGEGATNRTITMPTGMTTIVEVTVGRRQEAAFQAIAATGTTGTRTWTFSGTAVYNAYMVPLRPATNIPGTMTVSAATATAAAGAVNLQGDVDAITYVDSTVASSAAVTANTAINIAKPAGLQDDDYVVMLVGSRAAADATFTVAGGTGTWSELSHAYNGSGAPSLSLWGKRVVTAASEPANYTYQFNQSAQSFAEASAYRGVDLTDPTDSAAAGATGSDATAEQSLTPSANKTMLVFGTGYNASTSTTQTGQPAGYTQREHNTAQMRGSLFDDYQPTAAASNPVETNSGVDMWAAILVALAPLSLGATGTLTVTAATATAQAEAVTLDAASVMTAGTATATGAATAVALAGQARLPVVAATATSQAEAVTFDAAAKLTASAATATAQGQAVNLAAAQTATFPAGTATATAQAEAVTLKGQGILAVTAAPSTAQAEAITFDVAARLIAATATATAAAQAVTFDAASRLTVVAAPATAEGQNVQLGAGGGATLAVTPATATATAGAVTFTAPATMSAGTATANAAANGNLTAAAKLTVSSATATAAAQATTLRGLAVLAVNPALATANAGAVSLKAGALLTIGAATANAQAYGDLFGGVPLPPAIRVFVAGSRSTTVDAGRLVGVGPADARDVVFDGSKP